MFNVQFDVNQFNKKMAVDTGEVMKAESKGRLSFKRGITMLVYLGVAGLITLPVGYAVEGKEMVGLAIGVASAVLFYFIVARSILKTAKKDYKDSLINKYWRTKLSGYNNYDKELGITGDDIVRGIDSIREVYFKEGSYEAYIPINNMVNSDEDNETIKFKEVPEDYHKLSYYKDKLTREDLLELQEVSVKLSPTFDEAVVMLQAEAEIRMQGKGYNPVKQLDNVMGKNSHIGLQTIGELNNKNKELLEISNKINNQDLPNLYKENGEILGIYREEWSK